MGGNKINWGLCISIVLHTLLMAVPMTITGVREFREIELFVMEEKPAVREERFIERPKTASMSRTIKQQVIKKPNPPIMPPPVEEQKIENETLMEPQKAETEITREERLELISQPSLAPNPVNIEQKDKNTEGESRKETSEAMKSKQTNLPQDEVGFGSEDGPRFLRREVPIYPLIARRFGKEGKVVLRLTIDENGNLLNVEVLEGAGYGLTEAAVQAVRRSKFVPAKKEGKSISSKAILPVRFTLRRFE